MKLGAAPVRTTGTTHRLVEAIDGIHRVEVKGRTVGYILQAGAVFVSLRGSVYNTSIEVGQSLDRDAAVDILLAH